MHVLINYFVSVIYYNDIIIKNPHFTGEEFDEDEEAEEQHISAAQLLGHGGKVGSFLVMLRILSFECFRNCVVTSVQCVL